MQRLRATIILAALLAGALSNAAPASAEPATNDNLANATPVTLPLPFIAVADTTSATSEADEPQPLKCTVDHKVVKTVWYRYRHTENVTLTIDTLGSSFDTIVAAYRGAIPDAQGAPPNNGATLVMEECNDDARTGPAPHLSQLELRALANTTYWFQVGGSNRFAAGTGDAGALVFRVNQRPANDLMKDAAIVGDLPFTAQLSTDAASLEPNSEPRPSCLGGARIGRTVWYRMNPAVTSVSFDTIGSTFHSFIAVYRGGPAGLAEMGCKAGTAGAQLQLAVLRPVPLFIQVGGVDAAGGNMALTVASVPVHDNRASAREATLTPESPYVDGLPPSPGVLPEDMIYGAGLEAGETGCPGVIKTMWYAFTTPEASGTIPLTVDTFGSGFDTTLAIFEDASTTPLACNDDADGTGSYLRIESKPATKYFVQVGIKEFHAFSNANFAIVEAAIPPPNDAFASATQLEFTPTYPTATQSMVGATTEGSEPRPTCVAAGSPVGESVWYRYTAPASNVVTFDTFGSSYDTVLAIYEVKDTSKPAALDNLLQRGCSDNLNSLQSRLLFRMTAGKTYWYQIGAVNGSKGNLAINAYPPVANDDFASAETVTNPFTARTNTTNATLEASELNPSCLPTGGTRAASVWYRITPQTGNVTLLADTLGSDFNTVLALYTEPAAGPPSASTLTEVACSDDASGTKQSRVQVSLTDGKTYWVQAAGLNGASGNLLFRTATLTPPGNDRFVNALTIGTPVFTDSRNTSNATLEPGEPVPSCLRTGGTHAATVWYRYVAPAGAVVAADTFGSAFDTVLGVYRARAGAPDNVIASLEQIACSEDSAEGLVSRASFATEAGRTYWLQVGSTGGQGGVAVLNLAAPPSNDTIAAAVPLSSFPVAQRQPTFAASTDAGEPVPACAPSGTKAGRSVWFRFAPAGTVELTADTLNSDYNTVLGVYSGSPGALAPVACSDDASGVQSSLKFEAIGNTTYYFQVAGVNNAAGNLSFNVLASPPTNDAFLTAAPITAAAVVAPSFTDTRTTYGATSEPGEPGIASCLPSGTTFGRSVWYRFTSPADVKLTISTAGSSFDHVMLVYEDRGSTGPGGLRDAQCSATGTITTYPGRGSVFYIQIAGVSGAAGRLNFSADVSLTT